MKPNELKTKMLVFLIWTGQLLTLSFKYPGTFPKKRFLQTLSPLSSRSSHQGLLLWDVWPQPQSSLLNILSCPTVFHVIVNDCTAVTDILQV